jgi:hypothetical protein
MTTKHQNLFNLWSRSFWCGMTIPGCRLCPVASASIILTAFVTHHIRSIFAICGIKVFCPLTLSLKEYRYNEPYVTSNTLTMVCQLLLHCWNERSADSHRGSSFCNVCIWWGLLDPWSRWWNGSCALGQCEIGACNDHIGFPSFPATRKQKHTETYRECSCT